MRASPPSQGADLSGVSTEELMRMRGSDEKRGVLKKAWDAYRAPAEIALTLGTSAIAAPIGSIAGLLKDITSGKWRPEDRAQSQAEAVRFAKDTMRDLTYAPRLPEARSGLETLGSLFESSKLAGIGPNEATMIAGLPIRESIEQVRTAIPAGGRTIGSLLRTEPEQPAMAGVGAAETSAEAMRRARAESMPVPIKLTKGEATRDYGQLRFEKETAKMAKEGAPLRARAVEHNENIVKNFDAWLDETGAQAPSLRLTGNAVDDALVSKAKAAKSAYQAAYRRAEEAGETAKSVSTEPLMTFLAENRASKKMAPVLQAAEDEAIRLYGAQKAGRDVVFPEQLSINELEQVRKLAVRLGRTDDTNAYFARQINEVIDKMTEGKGGKLYDAARGLYKEYAAEFKNQSAVRDLLARKPGTTDRKVAFEDVFRKSILSGSRDDTAAVLKSLEGAGAKGAQAKAELQGATIAYLRDEATKNAARDQAGNPVVSFAALNRAVRDLEADGKLELIFGKQRAQQIRDLTDLVADVNTAPPGVINTSNTGAVLLDSLGDLALGRLPTATMKIVGEIKQAIGNRAVNRRVAEALAEPGAEAQAAALDKRLH